MNRGYGYDQSWSEPGSMDQKTRLNHASVLRRIGAYIIDAFIVGLVIGIIMTVLFMVGSFTFPEFTDIDDIGFIEIYLTGFFLTSLFVSVGITLLYFSYFESKSGGGATLAKKMLDIMVVDRHGGKVSFSTSFLRNLARLIWSIPVIGWLLLLLDVFLIADGDQRIGDKLANTYVVKEEYGSIYKTKYGTPQGKVSDRIPQQHRPPEEKRYPRERRETPPPPPPDEEENSICSDCRRKMRYIDKYERWYCDNCKKYD